MQDIDAVDFWHDEIDDQNIRFEFFKRFEGGCGIAYRADLVAKFAGDLANDFDHAVLVIDYQEFSSHRRIPSEDSSGTCKPPQACIGLCYS